MKRGHIIFNVVGLLIAALLLFSALSAWFVLLPGMAVEKRGFFHFLIALETIMFALIAGGGIANFAKGRLASWPTGSIIFGYCISIWLFPLAVWGLVILLNEHKRLKLAPPQLQPA